MNPTPDNLARLNETPDSATDEQVVNCIVARFASIFDQLNRERLNFAGALAYYMEVHGKAKLADVLPENATSDEIANAIGIRIRTIANLAVRGLTAAEIREIVDGKAGWPFAPFAPH